MNAPRGLPTFDRLVLNSERQPDGCWIWKKFRNHSGYGATSVKGTLTLAHRAMWAAVHGPIQDGLHVLHKCDVRACINPDHLFLGTNADNVRDKVIKGRARGLPGELNPNAKFTDEDIAIILRTKQSSKDLAAVLGVHYRTICRIRNGTARQTKRRAA